MLPRCLSSVLSPLFPLCGAGGGLAGILCVWDWITLLCVPPRATLCPSTHFHLEQLRHRCCSQPRQHMRRYSNPRRARPLLPSKSKSVFVYLMLSRYLNVNIWLAVLHIIVHVVYWNNFCWGYVYYELKHVLFATLYSKGFALSIYTRTLWLQGH